MRPFKILFLSLGALIWLVQASAQQFALPDIGDAADAIMSSADEQRLAEAFMREVRQQLHVIDDPEVSAYLAGLAERLTAHLQGGPGHFSFFAVSDPAINAFAGPAGYIGVNSGLILASRTESELAAVLSHEMGHVIQHHIARTLREAQRMTLPAAAALLAAILIGLKSPEVGTAALAATTAGQMQHEISFTREHEEEADRVGMQILARSGFDPRGMPSFFERMLQSERLATRPPAFLLDHPVTESRIAESRARAEQYPHRTVPDDLSYEIIKARLRVLDEPDPRSAVSYFRPAMDTGTATERVAARYGYALALFQSGSYQEAQRQIAQLSEADPERIAYVILRARVLLALGQKEKGLKIFASALQSNPGDLALTLAYAQALLDGGEPDLARRKLIEYLRDEGFPGPEAYRLLAQAQGEAGYAADAHQSLAEYYYGMGDRKSAIKQLEMALRLTKDDFYRTSRTEARLEQLHAEEKAARK